MDELRDAGEATDDLVDFTRALRAECPWDQEQTHASLTRHLLEEAYEALDALEAFVRVDRRRRLDARWCITLKRSSATCSSRSSFTPSWATRRDL
jgi:hypothetical protein